MRFRSNESATLPPLAWCARIDASAGSVVAWHGAAVEADVAGLVEGAWDGDFAHRGLAERGVMAGTGLRIIDGRVHCFAGTFLDAPLFTVEDGGVVHASNSIFFALAATGEAPDPDYPFYSSDILLAWRGGCHRPGRRLRTAGGRPLRVFLGGSIECSAAGITASPPPAGEEPVDYESYTRLLLDRLDALFRNAADPRRRHRYLPLAAISTGYDSVATAALARTVGCRDALTYRDSRREDPGADSGVEVARSLGLRCEVRDRWDYLRLDTPEPPFAVVPFANNVPVSACRDVVAGRLFITGAAGDVLWHPGQARACVALAQPWTNVVSGFGQHEFRLHAGSLTFAPVSIGGLHARAIDRIMTSPGMRPWSVGGDYDRPLPRRIAEEAGVPRAMFGMRKHASGHAHLTAPENFSPQGLESLRDFMRRHDRRPSLVRRGRRLRFDLRRRWWSLTPSRAPRFVVPSVAQRTLPFVVNQRPKDVPWPYAFTLQWGFERLQARYAIPAWDRAAPDRPVAA